MPTANTAGQKQWRLIRPQPGRPITCAVTTGVSAIGMAAGALWGFWNSQRTPRQLEAMLQERGA
jgi:hypothetical protein